MERKVLFRNISENRFLIISCVMLILGSVFGVSMLRIIPEEIAKNYYMLITESGFEIFNLFINRFSFSFIILLCIFLSGTSILGIFSAPAAVFINGLFIGLLNALNYRYSGMDHIINSLILFFTSAVFNNFIIILMSENAFIYSSRLIDAVANKTAEKPHYNAKKLTVKFICFTVFMGFVSLISAVFTGFIQPVL